MKVRGGFRFRHGMIACLALSAVSCGDPGLGVSAENTTGELVLLRYTEQQDVTVVVVPAHTSGFVRAFGGPAVGAYVEILDTECTPIRPRLNVPEVGAVTVRIDPDSASAVQTQLPNPPALVFDQVALCGSSRGLDEIPSEP